MEQIARILQSEIKYGWIILSMIVGVVSHIVRAMRWQLQLRALGNPVSFRTLTNAIFGTYAMNLLFPRLGEVWRCGYVARREDMSFTLLLGSVVSGYRVGYMSYHSGVFLADACVARFPETISHDRRDNIFHRFVSLSLCFHSAFCRGDDMAF